MASSPALVGQKYKDIPTDVLNNVLKMYEADMHYFGYGLDREKWLLTW